MRFNERIQVDGAEITDADIVRLYRRVKRALPGGREPTFFEFTTAMALDEFARRKVDWAVIETGMGGRLDATNVVAPAVTDVTNVSLEHREYLGPTLAAIASEKAGIIKRRTPVVTGVRQPSALAVIRRTARMKSAPLYCLGKEFPCPPTHRPAAIQLFRAEPPLVGSCDLPAAAAIRCKTPRSSSPPVSCCSGQPRESISSAYAAGFRTTAGRAASRWSARPPW